MAQMQVFVSHSHEDDAFCRAIVQGLRDAGVDVWYDEHSMATGQLIDSIERELRTRPVFILVLSPAALRSRWVRDETKWAYARFRRNHTHIILPVLASALADEDDIWMFLQDFKRIEAPGLQPYPIEEAVRRLLHALALTPLGETPASTAPQPAERVDDLLERGRGLFAQKRYAEATPLFERATQLNVRSFDAWANLGSALQGERRYEEALKAYERAISLDENQLAVWNNKGDALNNLQRYEEAQSAFERALALDPNNAIAWSNKGVTLLNLGHNEEALAAFNQALVLDPNLAKAWVGKGTAHRVLQQHQEALDALDQALSLDPNNATAWSNKGLALESLKQYSEALAAYDHGFDQSNPQDWRAHVRVYRALGLTAKAEVAERHVKELGG